MWGRSSPAPAGSASRIARGPNLVPGRPTVVSSIGAPTMATSTPSSSAGSSTNGSLSNAPMPANEGSPGRFTRMTRQYGRSRGRGRSSDRPARWPPHGSPALAPTGTHRPGSPPRCRRRAGGGPRPRAPRCGRWGPPQPPWPTDLACSRWPRSRGSAALPWTAARPRRPGDAPGPGRTSSSRPWPRLARGRSGSIGSPRSQGYAVAGYSSPVATTARELIVEGERRLRRSPAIDHWPAGRERDEARVLLALCLGVGADALDEEDEVDGRRVRRYRTLIRRRSGGEPMAHILGWTEFGGLRLRVRPGAFVPRQSSEFLVEQTLRRLRRRQRPVAVDVATGIGPIALAVGWALRRAQVHGIDLSTDALTQARANAKALRLGNVHFHRGDLFAPLPDKLR